MVLTGDALLVGDAGRPDLHAHGDQTVEEMAGEPLSLAHRAAARAARSPRCSIRPTTRARCAGAGLSANPASTIGFERRHNPALQFDSEDAFVEALIKDIPPAPEQQAEIVAANRAGARSPTLA